MVEIIDYKSEYHDELAHMVNEFNDYIVSLDKDDLAKSFDSQEDIFKYTDKLIEDAVKMNGFLYLAMAEGKPVGFIQGIVRDSKEELFYALTHKVGNHGWVGEFFVDEKYRGQGVGKALFEKARTFLADKQCITLNLEVFGYNLDAVEVYKAFGMKARDHVMNMFL